MLVSVFSFFVQVSLLDPEINPISTLITGEILFTNIDSIITLQRRVSIPLAGESKGSYTLRSGLPRRKIHPLGTAGVFFCVNYL
jgi:hypothetical protein